MSDALQQIQALVALHAEQTKLLADLTEQQTAAKEVIQRIERDDIPSILKELGMSSVKMSDGTTVGYTQECDASVSAERETAAYAWLERNKLDGIIKSSVAFEFGSGEYNAMLEFAAKVAGESQRRPEIVRKIHPQTLKAFVKEQIAADAVKADEALRAGKEPEPFPRELFGVYEFDKAKIKPPAKRAARTRTSAPDDGATFKD